MGDRRVVEVLGALEEDVAELQSVDLDALSGVEVMRLLRSVEGLRRRFDHATDRVVGHLDATGKHGADGHKTAKSAVKHLGRLPGAEAHARVRVARALRMLPAVAAAYEGGHIPTASVRAIASVAANPRVQPFLDDMVDKIFAEQASEETYDDFVDWLRTWERLADADGADQDAERSHAQRNATLVQDPVDGSWSLRGNSGALQGAVMAEVFAAYEAAEWEADREAAMALHGPDVTPDQFPRTPAQRRGDALHAIFRRAAATPADAQSPEPLVNVVIDAETLETELARAARDPDAGHDPARVDERICRTTSGHVLHPSDAVAALLVGHVRRVVVDAASNVIDLGRRRRCFTGSSREAVMLRSAIRDRGGTGCFWSGCDSPPWRQQADHHEPWRELGATDSRNGFPGCGFHNRLKETGFRPVRRPDGSFTLVRPDGTSITPGA